MKDNSFPKLAFECPKQWESMTGSEEKRFCEKCQHSIVNLSLLTVAERRRLISGNQGRLCVAYYRDINGEPISAEQRVKKSKIQKTAAALSMAALPLLAACSSSETTHTTEITGGNQATTSCSESEEMSLPSANDPTAIHFALGMINLPSGMDECSEIISPDIDQINDK